MGRAIVAFSVIVLAIAASGLVYYNYKPSESTSSGSSIVPTIIPNLASSSTDSNLFKFDDAKIVMLVHEKVNSERQSRGMGTLAWDSNLAKIAETHSLDMATRGFFDHDSPDGKGPDERSQEAGYTCVTSTHIGLGENLAEIPFGFADNEESLALKAFNGWMNSEHRLNIVHASYSKEGIGMAYTDGKVLITQNFC